MTYIEVITCTVHPENDRRVYYLYNFDTRHHQDYSSAQATKIKFDFQNTCSSCNKIKCICSNLNKIFSIRSKGLRHFGFP